MKIMFKSFLWLEVIMSREAIATDDFDDRSRSPEESLGAVSRAAPYQFFEALNYRW